MQPVTWSLKEIAEWIYDRQHNKYDVVIALDGPRGNGKSTLVYKLFTRIALLNGNKQLFNPKKDILFDRTEVLNDLEKKRFGFIFADEMINSAHNRDFWSTEQKDFVKMLNMYRDHFNILAGCIPFFYDMDTQLRKLVSIRFTVVNRGFAVIQFAKTEQMYGNDPWQTDINKKIESRWSNAWKKGQVYNPKFHNLTTFAGYLKYGPLGKKQEILYQQIKDDKRSELKKEAETEAKELKKDDFLGHILERVKQGVVTKEELRLTALNIGMTPRGLNTALNHRLSSEDVKTTVSAHLKSDNKRADESKNYKKKVFKPKNL